MIKLKIVFRIFYILTNVSSYFPNHLNRPIQNNSDFFIPELVFVRKAKYAKFRVVPMRIFRSYFIVETILERVDGFVESIPFKSILTVNDLIEFM